MHVHNFGQVRCDCGRSWQPKPTNCDLPFKRNECPARPPSPCFRCEMDQKAAREARYVESSRALAAAILTHEARRPFGGYDAATVFRNMRMLASLVRRD